MAVAKVVYKSSANATPETWMDVTQDTVESDKLLSSYTATKNDGTSITGSYSAPLLQSKTVTPTTSSQSILPDSGFGGMSQVTVNAIPSAYLIPSGTLSITSNASGIDVGSYASVDVNVAGGQVYTAYLDYNPTYNPTDEDFYKANVTLNNVVYDQYHREAGTSFTFSPGEILHCYTWDDDGMTAFITVDGIAVGTSQGKSKVYDYELPDHDLTIRLAAAKCYITERLPNEDTIITRTISGTYENSRVTTVGSYAFAYCTLLSAVSFPVCTTISSNAFYYCISLLSISFPVCTTINNYAFCSCTSLSSINFPECTLVSASVFQSCYSLTNASLPACTSIYSYAFAYCSSLTNVNLPACTFIANNAFASCKSLLEINLPECENIGSNAFANCLSLSYVNLPIIKSRTVSMYNIWSLGSYAFSNCRSLKTIIMPNNDLLNQNTFTSCYMLSEIVAPKVERIGTGCFSYCSALPSACFPRVTSVYSGAFAYCSNLTEVSFAATNIFQSAFLNCSQLSTVKLGITPYVETLSSGTISNFAFCSCYHLRSLYLLASYPYSLVNISAFYSTPISTYTNVRGSIYVRESLYQTYISATNWVTYSDRFVSLTDAQINELSEDILNVENETTAHSLVTGLRAPTWWNGIALDGHSYNITFTFERVLTGEKINYTGSFIWNGWGTTVALPNDASICFENVCYAAIILSDGTRMEGGNPYSIKITEIT